MKLFVGMPVSEDIIEKISKWREIHKHLPVRWIEDENLHITLVPPWEEERADEAIQNIYNLNLIPDIPLHFDSLSLGSNPHNPNLIWLTGKAPLKLIYLKDQAERIFKKSYRKHFKLHITIARFTYDASKNLTLLNTILPEKVAWSGSVKSVVLYESLGYSKYRKIARI